MSLLTHRQTTPSPSPPPVRCSMLLLVLHETSTGHHQSRVIPIPRAQTTLDPYLGQNHPPTNTHSNFRSKSVGRSYATFPHLDRLTCRRLESKPTSIASRPTRTTYFQGKGPPEQQVCHGGGNPARSPPRDTRGHEHTELVLPDTEAPRSFWCIASSPEFLA